jgi:hypothetical protein
MGRLFDAIRTAVREDQFLVSQHADERCEEREIATWQVVVGLEAADLLEERLDSQPDPSIVVR